MEQKLINDYKTEIVNTRFGCLGSSDATLIAKVANAGQVLKTAKKRLAVVKGLIPPTDGVKTKEMEFGDYIERKIYEYLSMNSIDNYESNPMWTSEKFSRKNVKLITHPDIVHKDDKNKIINVYEVKTTKFDVQQTKQTYKAQLFIHDIISKEIAQKIGYRQRVYLVHYDTNGIEDFSTHEFDATRLNVSRVGFNTHVFDIAKGMDIINDYLETFTEYYDEDTVNADLLPQKVKEQFDIVVNLLNEISQREKRVDEFKNKLYQFMLEKEIKSVSNDSFSITRVDATESHKVDYKSFFDEYSLKHPRKAKSLRKKYDVVTKRKGYVKINLKTK